jgi:superoxide reductase
MMTAENEYYFCEICGMVVKVLQGGGGTLVCCGQDMIKISEEKARAMTEQ